MVAVIVGGISRAARRAMPPETEPTTNRYAALRYPKPVLDKVRRSEADFANRDYAPFADELAIEHTMFRLYARPEHLWEWRAMAALLLGDVAGKRLLEFGCGMGEEAIYFAKLGAQVTAIDISEVGIASLRRRAKHHRLDIRAVEMRCDPTNLAGGSFDRIYGMGILHQIGIEAGMAEVARLLRPGGVGVFLEPLGEDAGIEAIKRFVMERASFLDHPVAQHRRNLTWQDIADATRRFTTMSVYPYHLLYRMRRLLPKSIFEAVRRFDHGLLTMVPSLRRYAGAAVIKVVK